MKFTTVASNDHPGLTRLLKSCEHFGVEMNVLGYNKPYYGNGTRVQYITEFLKSLDPNEIVLLTDAYDSFLVRDPSTLEEDFKKFDKPLIFSCEDNYYYRIQGVPHLFENRYYLYKYPKSQSRFKKYRFLNGGGYMGYAYSILELFEKAGFKAKMRSDQVILHRYLINKPGHISLDYNHEIFTNYGKFAQPDRFTVEDDVLTNNATGSHPYIFHFPGDKHRGMEEYAAQFSFLN